MAMHGSACLIIDPNKNQRHRFIMHENTKREKQSQRTVYSMLYLLHILTVEFMGVNCLLWDILGLIKLQLFCNLT